MTHQSRKIASRKVGNPLRFAKGIYIEIQFGEIEREKIRD